jgi:cobalt-zinc-cadmium efflux system protein
VSRKQRLAVVLVLNLALVAGLVTVGVTAHSLAVLAEGSDFLLDAAGVGVALLAIRLSARPASRARPEGYPNATSLAALVNAGWLLVLELIVAGAAADRLVNRTPAVHGLPVLVVSGIAALVMAAAALILRGDGDDGEGQAEERDLSVAAVLLDTIADAAAAAGVAAAGAVILATHGWYWLDPAVALAIAVIVAYHALALIREILGRLRSATAGSKART